MNFYISILLTFWILTLLGTFILVILKSKHNKRISGDKTKLRSEKLFKWLVLLLLFSGFIFMYPYLSILALIIFGSSQYLAIYYLGDIIYSNTFFIVYFIISSLLMSWIICLLRKENRPNGKKSGVDKSRVSLAFYSNFGMLILATSLMFYTLLMINYISFDDATSPSGWMEGDSIQ